MNAWLIEKVDTAGCVTGACLGECNGVLKFTTPHFAIRFSRKEDAEAGARAFGIRSVVAVEHSWDAVEGSD